MMDFPGKPNSLDAITSRHLLWTVERPAAVLRSAPRPGGTLVVIDGRWFPHGWDPGKYHDKCWYLAWVRHYCDDVRTKPPLLGQGPEEVRRRVVTAGFVDVVLDRLNAVEWMSEQTIGQCDPVDRLFMVTARKRNLSRS